MAFEYKTVGAPEKGKRQRGARSQSDRCAVAFDEVLQDEAVDGWEYLRTDLLPVTERAGWFGRKHEVHRAVMVFRRSLDPIPNALTTPSGTATSAPADDAFTLRRAPSAKPAPDRKPAPEPEVSDSPDLRLADIVRGPGHRKIEE
jgi:hypothetical protein